MQVPAGPSCRWVLGDDLGAGRRARRAGRRKCRGLGTLLGDSGQGGEVEVQRATVQLNAAVLQDYIDNGTVEYCHLPLLNKILSF